MDKDEGIYLSKLRKRAEEAISQRQVKNQVTSEDVKEILHELQIYQTELEMQNEHLRQTKTGLDDSRKKYFDLFNLAPIGYVTMDDSLVIQEDNLTFSKMVGATPGKILKKKLSSYVTPNSQDKLYLHVRRVLETKGKQSDEITLKGATETMVRIVSIPVIEDGKLSIRSALIDITEELKAERELQSTKARLETILANIPAAVMMAEAPSGKIIYTNPEMNRIYGIAEDGDLHSHQSTKALQGRHIDGSPYKPSDLPLARTISSGEAIKGEEIEFDVEGGKSIVMSMNSVPVRDPGGHVVAAVVIGVDITKMKEVERKIIDRSEALSRSNADLQQYAYVASHDLQEPLRMVVSYLSLLDRRYKGELDGRAQDYIKFAVEGGERMKVLISDLLEYSRIDTQAKPFEPLDLNEVLAQTLKNLEEPIRESDAQITAERLPTIMADENQMLRLLQNLIGNSIKFRGKERPLIHVGCDEAEKEYICSVADNGIGLNMQYADKIFQMFQRLHGREEYPGTGVGLAVAKKIIERHGGRMWVESEEGNGAKFYFSIPKHST